MSVYYNPEEAGLTVVGEVEWSEPSWSFDTTVVWFKEGQFYWASDSGCSCPSPFETFYSIADLNTGTDHDVIAYLMDRLTEEEKYSNGEEGYGRASVVELISKIRRLGTPLIQGV
jgi:hypothetical protein